MIIRNVTRKTIISSDLKEAKSFLDQFFGLLRQSNPRSLLFSTRFGIHTFGLRELIDVMVLDGGMKVIKMATVKPNSLFFWNPKYNKVLELPKGTIKKSKTKKWDTINIKN